MNQKEKERDTAVILNSSDYVLTCRMTAELFKDNALLGRRDPGRLSGNRCGEPALLSDVREDNQ